MDVMQVRFIMCISECTLEIIMRRASSGHLLFLYLGSQVQTHGRKLNPLCNQAKLDPQSETAALAKPYIHS